MIQQIADDGKWLIIRGWKLVKGSMKITA